MTVIKDKENQENRFRRLNVRKIVNLNEAAQLNYTNVEIEMLNADDLEKLYEAIKEKGKNYGKG